eukprot:RCo004322
MDASGPSSSSAAVFSVDGEISQLTAGFDQLVRKLKAERAILETERRKMLQDIEDERQGLVKDRLALEEERARFEQMRCRVEQAINDSKSKVTLNVGGEVYVSTLDTLTSEPDSMLAAMFSGKYRVETLPDGACFFDRDPKLFREILLYLRWCRDRKQNLLEHGEQSCQAYCPQVPEAEKDGLLREAQFYGIDTLVRILKHHTLEVSQDSRSKYRRISEALQDARDGDTIVVKPGVYIDSFTLYRSVHIIGDGLRSEIVIKSPAANVLESRAKGGLVKNLTLECVPVSVGGGSGGGGTSASAICGDNYCVLVVEGEIVVENCEIRNAGLSCVKVYGDSEYTAPVFRGNSIHHANQCGVLVTNRAGGLIEHNDVFENRFSGIEIRNSSTPEVKSNNIHDNRQNGVYIHSGGFGLLSGNTISGNNFNGINVEGSVKVTGNKVFNNSKRGIYHTADAVLVDNDVQNNAMGNIAPKK